MKRKRLRVVFTGLALVATSLGLWAFWLEPASLHNKTHVLQLPGWSETCDDLRVAVIADLHVGSPFNGLDNLERVITLTNEAKPDLILLAGDYVIDDVTGGTFVDPKETATHLADLSAPMGVFAVLGNHDWWYDAPGVTDAMTGAGITVLENSAQAISYDGCQFWLAGIADYWEGSPDIAKALSTVPDDAAVMALTHNPDVFPDVPKRVKITFAGHTHGGQVYLPLIGRPIVPSDFGERYAIGHIVEDGRNLFVSSGIGTSILPVRFLVPPEVSLVTLRSHKPDSAE